MEGVQAKLAELEEGLEAQDGIDERRKTERALAALRRDLRDLRQKRNKASPLFPRTELPHLQSQAVEAEWSLTNSLVLWWSGLRRQREAQGFISTPYALVVVEKTVDGDLDGLNWERDLRQEFEEQV